MFTMAMQTVNMGIIVESERGDIRHWSLEERINPFHRLEYCF